MNYYFPKSCETRKASLNVRGCYYKWQQVKNILDSHNHSPQQSNIIDSFPVKVRLTITLNFLAFFRRAQQPATHSEAQGYDFV